MKAVACITSSTETKEPSVKQRELKKACEDFEAVITGYLFKSMRETIPKADNEEEGQARDLYESMMDESLAKELSHGPGLGLAKTLYKQLAPLVEDANHPLKSDPSSTDRLVRGGIFPAQKK